MLLFFNSFHLPNQTERTPEHTWNVSLQGGLRKKYYNFCTASDFAYLSTDASSTNYDSCR
jgi:hypothetical protein